mgnify:CR=1 FL=1
MKTSNKEQGKKGFLRLLDEEVPSPETPEFLNIKNIPRFNTPTMVASAQWIKTALNSLLGVHIPDSRKEQETMSYQEFYDMYARAVMNHLRSIFTDDFLRIRSDLFYEELLTSIVRKSYDKSLRSHYARQTI